MKKFPAPPLNVALVLDRSTSMKDEKMDVLKNAAIKVMRNLRPQDIFQRGHLQRPGRSAYPGHLSP
jgi:hypothetical protein